MCILTSISACLAPKHFTLCSPLPSPFSPSPASRAEGHTPDILQQSSFTVLFLALCLCGLPLHIQRPGWALLGGRSHGGLRVRGLGSRVGVLLSAIPLAWSWCFSERPRAALGPSLAPGLTLKSRMPFLPSVMKTFCICKRCLIIIPTL